MDDFDFDAARGEAVADLEEATRIAGGDDGGAGGRDMVEFTLQKFVGHFGLDEVVDARAAAAPHRFGQRHHLQAGNFREEFARLGGDFLAVAEMAGVVIGDAGLRTRLFRRAKIDLDEPFADVPDFPGPLRRLGRVTRIVLEEAVEMLEMRSATGGIGDDGVEPVEIELVEEAAGVALGHFIFAVVGVKRSAAALRRGRENRATVGAQDVGGVAVDVAVDEVLDAAGEEADPVGFCGLFR